MPEAPAELISVSYLRWIVLLPLLGAIINRLGGALIQKGAGKRAISALACVAGAGWRLRSRCTASCNSSGSSRRSASCSTGCSPGSRSAICTPTSPSSSIRCSAVMILIVTGVGGLIHIYSTGYMHEEPAYWRFFAYLNLFTFAMLDAGAGRQPAY